MGLFGLLITYVAPAFLITSPLTSYADQIRNIHVTKSSRGFSLDTPLIMLIASILRCFYWLGTHFETSLLLQSMLMIAVQLVLLKVALDNRPSAAQDSSTPFSNVSHSPRPYSFWQWRSQRPYWEFLAYFTLTVAVLQMLLGANETFVSLLGFTGLGIEATLPLPQVLQNHKARSCHGFRLSVLASWLAGDIMKLVFFSHAEHVGLSFKLCAITQMCLDSFLGVQFYWYGNGSTNSDLEEAVRDKEMEMRGVAS